MFHISYPAERNHIAESGYNYVVENFQSPKLVNDFARYIKHLN